MIIKTNPNDIFKTEQQHIAFAINQEGYNDAGFAGIVSEKYWNELANCGYHDLGTVLTKKVGNKTFHALVCHSLKGKWGDNQNEIIKECFDKIESNGMPISSIAIGTGLIGMLSGANFKEIMYGMHKSNNKIVLHVDNTLEEVLDICKQLEQEKEKTKEMKLSLDLHKNNLI